jgi:hypothetical protein
MNQVVTGTGTGTGTGTNMVTRVANIAGPAEHTPRRPGKLSGGQRQRVVPLPSSCRHPRAAHGRRAHRPGVVVAASGLCQRRSPIGSPSLSPEFLAVRSTLRTQR